MMALLQQGPKRVAAWGAVAAAVLLPALTWAQEPDAQPRRTGGQKLELTYEYIWQGAGEGRGITPLRLVLENFGRADSGEIVVATGRSQLRIPFEAPEGSKREYTVYPSLNPYGNGADIRLLSRSTQSILRLDPPPYTEAPAYGVISDILGRYSFPQKSGSSGSRPTGQPATATPQAGYAKPRRAPERSVGYAALDALILGEGAERISDEEAGAIKRWVLSGGTLIFATGSSTLAINDARWRGWSPVGQAAAGRAPMPRDLVDKGAPREELSWAVATPALGAVATMSDGRLERAEIDIGLGKVIFLAWNPAEQPLRSWPNRMNLLLGDLTEAFSRKTKRRAEHRALNYAMEFTGGEQEEGQTPTEKDPFQIRPPGGWLVLGILLLYWVVVIPFMFFALNKLGRANLAWFLGPVVAVAFAFVFFSFAQGLYSSAQARTQAGIFLATEGKPEALFVGSQQFFFSRQGSYALAMKDVEAMFPLTQTVPTASPLSSFQDDTLDTGRIEIPRAGVPSLAFRETALQQAQTWEGGITSSSTSTRRAGELVVTGEVTNTSPYTLDGASVAIDNGQSLMGNLAPGAKGKFTLRLPPQTVSSPSLVLSARIKGRDFGITSGALSKARDNVLLVMSLRPPVPGGRR